MSGRMMSISVADAHELSDYDQGWSKRVAADIPPDKKDASIRELLDQFVVANQGFQRLDDALKAHFDAVGKKVVDIAKKRAIKGS